MLAYQGGCSCLRRQSPLLRVVDKPLSGTVLDYDANAILLGTGAG